MVLFVKMNQVHPCEIEENENLLFAPQARLDGLFQVYTGVKVLCALLSLQTKADSTWWFPTDINLQVVLARQEDQLHQQLFPANKSKVY